MSDFLRNFLVEEIEKKSRLEEVDRDPIPSGTGGSRARGAKTEARSDSSLKGFSTKYLRDNTIEATYNYDKKPQKLTVPEFKLTPTTLLNKSVIFYGSSGSGKTFLVNHFLYIMKDVFPMVEIFCPTNDQNHSYDGKVPDLLLRGDRFGLDEIRSTYDRQKFACCVYDLARREELLHGIFMRVVTPLTRDTLQRIRARQEKVRNELEASNLTPSQKKAERDTLKKQFQDEIVAFYHGVINENIRKLEGRPDLSEEETLVVRYRNLVPYLLTIFDDTATEIKQLIALGKAQKNDTISNYFFKGRHSRITHFYVFQDDAKLESDIRKNAFYSIFTSKQTAICFFRRAANGFTKEFQAMAMAAIEAVLYPTNEDGTPNHKKLVYIRETNSFAHVTAEDHDEFRMCSEATWRFCQAASQSGNRLDKQNPFYQRFAGKPTKPTPPSYRNFPPG